MDDLQQTREQTTREGSVKDSELAGSVRRARQAWQRVELELQSVTPRSLGRIVLLVLVATITVWFFYTVRSALLPFILGLVLAYLLLPLVGWLSRWIPRWLAVLLVLLMGIGLIVGLIALVVPAVVQELGQLIGVVTDTRWMTALINKLQDTYRSLTPDLRQFVADGVSRILTQVRDNVLVLVQAVGNFLVNGVFGIVNTISFLAGFLVLPFWLFYTLRDEPLGARRLQSLVPTWMSGDFWAVTKILDRDFTRYVRGQLFLGLTIGLMTLIGLSILQMIGVQGIQYNLLLAVFSGLMELVPFVGPTIAAVPLVLLGLANSWQSALALLIMQIVIQQLENNFFAPRITSAAVNLHPAILTPVMIGMAHFGFVWVLLAAPLVAALRDLSVYAYRRLLDPPSPAGVLPWQNVPQPNAATASDAAGGKQPINVAHEVTRSEE